MKVFESLNCCLCKSPFVASANQPKSPRHLACGKAVCHKCFEAEKALNKEERAHRCENECFLDQNFSFSLIEILSSNSLVHDPNRSGYLLAEVISPECPVCHEEFTVNGCSRPFVLNCRHDLCQECFSKCRKANDGENKDKLRYLVSCPKCNTVTLTNYLSADDRDYLRLGSRPTFSRIQRACDYCNFIKKMLHCPNCSQHICLSCAEKFMVREEGRMGFICTNCKSKALNSTNDNDDHLDKQLTKFLGELPEMTRQLTEIDSTEFRFCGDCKSMDSIEKMFHCSPCKRNICGSCTFEKHKLAEHQVVKLLQNEILNISNTMKQVSIEDVAAYQGIFPELHSKLGDDLRAFQEKLAFKSEMLRNKKSFGAFQEDYIQCKRLKADFESFSEEYMPNLRKYKTQLEDLIKELDKEHD